MIRAYLKLAALLAVMLALAGPALASTDFEAGFAAYSQGDYETALQEWQPLAEAGDPRAQVGLGFMHEKGLGVPQDHTKAVRWYRLGSEQGDPIAEYNLAVMYGNGTGVLRDYVKAFALFSLSAEHGNAEAGGSLAYIERLMTPLELSEARDTLVAAGSDPATAARTILADGAPLVASQPAAPPPESTPQPQIATAARPEPTAATPEPIAARPEPIAAVQVPAAPAAAVIGPATATATTPAPTPVITAVAPSPTPSPPASTPTPAGQIAILPAAQSALLPPVASASAWRVHMASFRSEAAAVTEWQRLKARHGDELADMKLIVEPIDLPDKGRFYRVLAGPIVDKAKADQLCASLAASDQYCRALR